MIRLAVLTAALCLCLVMLIDTGLAHDAQPLEIDITALSARDARVKIQWPDNRVWHNPPVVDFGAGCSAETPAATASNRQRNPNMASSIIVCTDGFAGRRLSYAGPPIPKIMRYTDQTGTMNIRVTGPNDDSWTLPEQWTAACAAARYFRAGAEHLATGYDHILFLILLIFLAGTAKAIIIAVSGFTVGHSVSLAGGSFGLVSIPSKPLEALIALSIVILAAEILRGDKQSLTMRRPAAASCLFGLLHGLGFASFLRESGLPDGHIFISLLSFNVGIEIGQLALIAAGAALVFAARKVNQIARSEIGSAQITWFTNKYLNRTAVYGIGLTAAFWTVERIATFSSVS